MLRVEKELTVVEVRKRIFKMVNRGIITNENGKMLIKEFAKEKARAKKDQIYIILGAC